MAAAPITFAGGTLDRVGNRRADAAWIEAARADPRARAVVAGRRGVQVEQSPLDGRDGVLLGVDADGAPVFAVEAIEGDELTDLRMASGGLAPADAGLLAYAQSMLHWHRSHRYCGVCGEALVAREAGFARACVNDHVAHPRTDAVVIMLVVDGDRCLLGRQPAWPPGRYSALAGFVEPGESLEAAVAREVWEEARVEVAEVRYRASQPWPFPAQLMIGFEADYAGGEAVADDAELDEVRWFEREALAEAARAGDHEWLLLPPPIAIARRLVEAWLGVGR